MSRRARLAWAGLAATAAIAIGLAICRLVLRPPVLTSPDLTPLFGRDIRTVLPDTAQRVELPLDARTTLCGWYLPADEGAPLVLHLLESSASADAVHSSRTLAARQLADLGFASLFLDYAGVGASSGARSTANLGRDAQAMWDEALRRVDGDPARVVLRCTSLGTLAALPLLQGGARPAGVIFLLPVLPETLASRFARSFYGSAAALLVRAAFRRVVDEDLFETVRGTPTAWLAVQADRDQMTSAVERDAIEAAVVAAGGRTARLADDHLVAALELRALCAAEIGFLTEVVPGVRDVEARWQRCVAALSNEQREAVLADDALVARLSEVAAWSHAGDARALLAVEATQADPLQATRIRWWLGARRSRELTPEVLRCVADLGDPAGAIPLEVLLEASRNHDVASRAGGLVGHAVFGPAEIEVHVRRAVLGAGEPISRSSTTLGYVRSGIELHPGELLARLSASGLSEIDARRQLARVLLKVHGIPDRCVRNPDGTLALEYFARDTWRAIQPDPSAPALAAEDSAWNLLQLQLDASVED